VRPAGGHGKRQVRFKDSAMNRKLLLLAAIAITTPLAPAAAWFHAGGWSGSGDRSSWSAHSWRGGTAAGGGGVGSAAAAAAPPAAAAARGTPPAIAAARRAAAAARGRRQAPTAITITAVRTTITAATTAPTTRRLWSIPTAPVATIAAAGTPAARSRPAWRAGT